MKRELLSLLHDLNGQIRPIQIKKNPPFGRVGQGS